MLPKLSTLLGLGIVIGAGVAMAWVLSRRKKWRLVGKLSKIYIYPIKSGRYRVLTEAECTPLGLRYSVGDGKLPIRDRFFIVYKADTMSFMSAKFNAKLLHLNVEPKDERTMILSYPKTESIEVNLRNNFEDEMIELWDKEKIRINDCGDDAAKWVSKVIAGKDSGYRLGYWPEKEMWRRDITYHKNELEVFKFMRSKYLGAYADLASYLIINDSSIQDLNTRLEGGIKTQAINFRPNFVIEGSKPYEEDKWHWIKIGEVILERFRPCTRCLAITMDPDTGERNERNEPLTTLRTYRTMKILGEVRVDANIPVMGCYAGLHEGGKIKCGDTVYVSD